MSSDRSAGRGGWRSPRRMIRCVPPQLGCTVLPTGSAHPPVFIELGARPLQPPPRSSACSPTRRGPTLSPDVQRGCPDGCAPRQAWKASYLVGRRMCSSSRRTLQRGTQAQADAPRRPQLPERPGLRWSQQCVSDASVSRPSVPPNGQGATVGGMNARTSMCGPCASERRIQFVQHRPERHGV